MISEIHLKNFRNYSEEKVLFNEGINIFCGNNGQGKTNLLEAVYFLGMLSSFRKTDAAQMIRQGEGAFAIRGIFKDDGVSSLFIERCHDGWKEISADGGVFRKKLDYLGKVRMVVFSPDELELIQGSPEGRRRYLDKTFFNICHHHLRRLKQYKKVLKQRNSLLKKGGSQSGELDVWSEKLADAGAKVILGRLEVVSLFNEKLAIKHPFIGTDKVSVGYVGSCGVNGDVEQLSRTILDRLGRVRKDEERRRMTLAGPHRDDMEISVNGQVAKSFSSRGEMRSVLLALKVAEMEIYRSTWQETPLILLDDVASELDIGRRKALIEFLRDQGNQVLITTTEAENLPLLDSEKGSVFNVCEGKILN